MYIFKKITQNMRLSFPVKILDLNPGRKQFLCMPHSAYKKLLTKVLPKSAAQRNIFDFYFKKYVQIYFRTYFLDNDSIFISHALSMSADSAVISFKIHSSYGTHVFHNIARYFIILCIRLYVGLHPPGLF